MEGSVANRPRGVPNDSPPVTGAVLQRMMDGLHWCPFVALLRFGSLRTNALYRMPHAAMHH